jgi:hypothetical protein
MEENLNIDYHVKQLILTTLNGCDTLKVAAERLKVTPRTLYTYINQYDLVEQHGVWKTHLEPKKEKPCIS